MSRNHWVLLLLFQVLCACQLSPQNRDSPAVSPKTKASSGDALIVSAPSPVPGPSFTPSPSPTSSFSPSVETDRLVLVPPEVVSGPIVMPDLPVVIVVPSSVKPLAPGGLRAVATNCQTAWLMWNNVAPSINQAIASYTIIQDGKLLRTVTDLQPDAPPPVQIIDKLKGNTNFSFTVTSVNTQGISSEVSVAAPMITPPCHPVILQLSSKSISSTVASAIGMDVLATSDIDGTLVSYAWDFGDGSSSTGSMVSHVYINAGRYTINVTAFDYLGSEYHDSAQILVNPALVPVPAILLSSRTLLSPKISTIGNKSAIVTIDSLSGGSILSIVFMENGVAPVPVILPSGQGFDAGNVGSADLEFSDATTAIVLVSKNVAGPLWAVEYKLNDRNNPSSATLVNAFQLGDSDSRNPSLVKLSSGALVAGWSEQSFLAAEAGFAYRGISGQWSFVQKISLKIDSAGIGAREFVMAQHPIDGRIWAFIKGDSSHNIAAIALRESNSALTVDFTDGYFISQADEIRLRPHPEFPHLIAISDPVRGTLFLSYQSAVYTHFPFGTFSSGAYMTVTQLSVGGTPSVYAHLQIPVERVEGFGAMSVTPTDISLVYLPFDTTAQELLSHWQVSSFSNGRWGAPQNAGCGDYRPIPSLHEKEMICRSDAGLVLQKF